MLLGAVIAGLRRPGRRDDVLAIGLASAPTTLAVGAVNFDHTDALIVQMAGETGAVAAGALDTHEFERTEASEPAEQTAIAGRGGLEGLRPEQGTAVVQRSGDVHTRYERLGGLVGLHWSAYSAGVSIPRAAWGR
jgi:hypothetical protein